MRATLPEKKIQHSKKTKEMYANFRATLADDTSLWEHVMENIVENSNKNLPSSAGFLLHNEEIEYRS